MRNSKADVVATALRVLDAHGLESCSMRRVAAELGVQPSALYHHVRDKQTLLAHMADEIIGGVDADDAAAYCAALRRAMLAVRDGADVVATASAFRLGASEAEARLVDFVGADGARTLLLFTFGHAQVSQTQLQAQEFGVLPHGEGSGDLGDELERSFRRGIEIILQGIGGLERQPHDVFVAVGDG